ncbi:MAG: HupU protein [Granulosicoccaceae bacterium]
MTDRQSLLWLQSGGCGGCSMSLLNAESPTLYDALELAGIDLLWHPSLSETCGESLLQLLQDIEDGVRELDILCLEGSVLRGPNNTGLFHRLGGSQRSTMEWLRVLSARAGTTVAVGSCAAFGGITASGENITDACGLQYEGEQLGGLLSPDWHAPGGLPVVNIAGCPTHPNWVLDTLTRLAQNDFNKDDLDSLARPRQYTDHLVHHGCPRNEYYEYKASAEAPGHLGCMMEHQGCLGTQARADCNTRLWNGEGSCLRGGYPCINCTAPDFERPRGSYARTPKIAGIPVGLPTDMPKAWFVALASLSKAATPERLRKNATATSLQRAPDTGEHDE